MSSPETAHGTENFIVFEGIDGSGTTTQLRMLAAALEAAGRCVVTTSEPTDRPEGALIRRILSGSLDAHPGTVAHLFAADRHEHLHGEGGILESIAAGMTVVCDRYVASSLAYQGSTCGRDLPRELNSRFPAPGLTLFFDIDPELSMKRVGRRNRLEIYEKLHIQRSVRDEYEESLAWLAGLGWKIVRIDASRDLETVGKSVAEAVSRHLGTRIG